MSKTASKIDKSLLIRPTATAPVSPEINELWNDSSDNKLKLWNGSSWKDVSEGGSGGAIKVVEDLTERDAIPLEQRYEGMLVYVKSDELTYQLKGGIANSDWVAIDEVPPEVPIVTDWEAYTPIITNSSGGITNYTVTGMRKRIGDTLYCMGTITFSSTPASFFEIIVSLPSGLEVDETKLMSPTYSVPIGYSRMVDNSIQYYGIGTVHYYGSDKVAVRYSGMTSTSLSPIGDFAITETVPFAFNVGDSISWNFSIPIEGWTVTE